MTRKKRSLWAAAGLTIFFATACSDKAQQPGNAVPTPAPAASEPSVAKPITEPVSLVFYTDEAGVSQDNFDKWIAEPLKKKYPNYTLTYIPTGKGKTLPEMVTNGETFDVFFSTGNNTLNQYGLHYDMTALLKHHGLDLNVFDDSLVTGMRQANDGTNGVYALPVWNDILATFYNKDLFDKFGVSYPANGLTWDQAIEISKKLTRFADNKQYFGLSYNTTLMVRLNSYSLPLVDAKTEKPTINTEPKWKTLYQLFLDTTVDQGFQDYVKAKSSFPYTPDFLSGSVGMLIGNSNIAYIYPEERLSAFNWDMVSMPTFADNPGVGSQPFPWYFSITSKSNAKDGAMQALKFLASSEYQMEQAAKFGRVPVVKDPAVKSAIGKEMWLKGKNITALTFNKMAPVAYQSPYTAMVRPFYGGGANNLAKRDMDINTALRTIEEQAQKEIDKSKGK